VPGTEPYEATWESVRTHPVPSWYDDAKLGVFLHWGLYSVPAWAPQVPDIQTILKEKGPAWMLRHNPYAEWYANTVQLPRSPTRRHHDATYGPGFAFDGFVPMFEQASSTADLAALASVCRDAGARYVVLTTKHHEGYCLWPTTVPHPVKGAYHSRRDLVGDLTEAVRHLGMKMGLYYSGGYDWPYNKVVMKGLADALLAGPTGEDYARYAEAHVRDLIARYRPSVLWNDIGWPAATDLPGLFADYYNTVEDGVVNDRWLQSSRRGPLFDTFVRVCSFVVQHAWGFIPDKAKKLTFSGARHADFTTAEYAQHDHIVKRKWEATRGVGHSFGANHNEARGDVISAPDLVRLLVDVVAKNGNLLIGVGPAPDGTLPDWQTAPLAGLGRWLKVNGDAVYGTRPWLVPGATTAQGTEVRFTTGGGALYATVFDAPPSRQLVLPGLRADELRQVDLLGAAGAVEWSVGEGTVSVTLPERLPPSPAYALRLAPASAIRPLSSPTQDG
jgi:alpha-L-fucosidase